MRVGREGGRKGGRKEGREGGREGGREKGTDGGRNERMEGRNEGVEKGGRGLNDCLSERKGYYYQPMVKTSISDDSSAPLYSNWAISFVPTFTSVTFHLNTMSAVV